MEYVNEILEEDPIEPEVRNVMCYIEEKSESRGWENAEYYACEKFGEDLTRAAITSIMKGY